MIVLDTNVISGLMDVGRDPHLVPWLDQVGAETVWITAIAVFEIKGGIDSLVDSRRKRALLAAFDTFLDRGFRDRVLPFDHNTPSRQHRSERSVIGEGALPARTIP